nr:unnamed protein product [Digitaria exilis]
MELKPGMSALVTGGASGIGKKRRSSLPAASRNVVPVLIPESPLLTDSFSSLFSGKALCIAFAQKGLFVTVVDFSEENGKEAAMLVQKENNKFHGDIRVPSSIFVKCDVSNADNLAAAFEKHVRTYGGLDICINCAGIANKTLVYNDTSDGARTWRHAVNVNLVAVIDGTRIASQIMRSQKKPGVIINIGSAAGLYPMIFDPSYSATKDDLMVQVNFSSGRYFSGNPKEIASRLPFDAGFEVPAKHLLPVPRPDPEVVAMLTSGLTASIGLEKAGQMTSGKVVLVTAAAGGTGQFAVQLAKLAGNKVVATCGGESKAQLLASLGVDRVINYRSERIKDVLKKEFPRGVDIIYESVGGEMFDLCLNALAVHGHLIVIGMISQYQGEDGWKPQNYTGLCEKILAKSQTVAGFFLVQYAHLWQEHLDKLFDLYASGKLKVSLDPKKFLGVASVPDAVEYLHSGKSVGKVVLCIDPSYGQIIAKL